MPKYPLRELKYAKTRIKLLEVALKLYEDKKSSNITIEEICDKAEISMRTFFNYFPSMDHLCLYAGFIYAARLWHAVYQKMKNNDCAKDCLLMVFSSISENCTQYPGFLETYITHVLDKGHLAYSVVKLVPIEWNLLFPEFDTATVEKLDYSPSLSDIFHEIVQYGVDRKEFRADTDLQITVLYFITIFFSHPISTRFHSTSITQEEYYKIFTSMAIETMLTEQSI